MTLVPREQVADANVCGADADQHTERVRAYVEAGVDEIYVQQLGPDMVGSSPAGSRKYCRASTRSGRPRTTTVARTSRLAAVGGATEGIEARVGGIRDRHSGCPSPLRPASARSAQ
jgi:hypothetical protein